VERGNISERRAEFEETLLSGPSLSTKWRGNEGEASKGRKTQRARDA
jgi:hypothetical protein